MRHKIVTLLAICMFTSSVSAGDFNGVKSVVKKEILDRNKTILGEAIMSGTGNVSVDFFDSKYTKGTFYLNVERHRLIPQEELYYTGPNCTGTPFILQGGLADVVVDHAVAIAPPGNTIYIADNAQGTHQATVQSYWDYTLMVIVSQLIVEVGNLIIQK